MTEKTRKNAGRGEIVLYESGDGTARMEVRFEDETVWLTQQQMAELFKKDRTVIGRHIRNAVADGEIDPKVGCAKFAHTTRHGAIAGKTQRVEVEYYNLDPIFLL